MRCAFGAAGLPEHLPTRFLTIPPSAEEMRQLNRLSKGKMERVRRKASAGLAKEGPPHVSSLARVARLLS
jgi:hypothetical protein